MAEEPVAAREGEQEERREHPKFPVNVEQEGRD